ncbi:MAG TPA: alpha-L-fucosidase, partial [Puia sp.]
MRFPITKIGLLALLLNSIFILRPVAQNLPLSRGPYQPTDASLVTYKYPDWFRNAKFGIWAHWGPQAVPRRGDWYARQMYEQG